MPTYVLGREIRRVAASNLIKTHGKGLQIIFK